eukprot:TRINITY_DN25660_c0_g1_i1.p1 TRINITY_DN25660_c0_g1~~TRINITY_DN25660_c0_g1_i1.p1  ORF type:complete len:374 (-),score=90.77 TRINITY_DN25660_c0_g1_i1:79-1200(-)
MSVVPAATSMPYRHLGRTGLRVSALGFGSWVTFKTQTDTDAAYKLMTKAFKSGVNFFDNAEGYANGDSESIMGDVIERGVKDGVWQREDLVVTTKIFFGAVPGKPGVRGPNAMGLSRKHIVEGLTASLRRLKLSYVDVVFCHRPDPATPIEETVRAMNFAIDRGLAFYWGTSEWSAADITRAAETANRLGLVGPCCEQPQYSVLVRDRCEVEYAPLYGAYGTGLTIWSPLASGILTGKYTGGNIPEGSRLALDEYKWLRDKLLDPKRGLVEKADQFVAYAKSLELSPAQLAIAWTLVNPNVSTCILGATSESQLDENLAALEALPKLTPEVVAKINDLFGTPTLHESEGQAHRLRGVPIPKSVITPESMSTAQ